MGFRLSSAAKGVGGAAVLATVAAGCLLPNGTADTIALAGSDTTQDVMAAISTYYNTTDNSDNDTLDNILSVEANPNVVNGDSQCGTITYHSPPGAGEVVAPNGSSAGRDALRTSVNNGDGCIDIARSSSGPRAIGQDLATFEYYALALDAVGWASASNRAPANLTLAQLQGIYNCTFTNWSQVGGTAGPIERYWPQAGSGTRAFFQSDVLGFDPTTLSSASCPAVQLTQENTGQVIATNGDQLTAIVPYSMANWIAHARGTVTDQRAGQTLRNLNGQALVTFPGGVATPNTGGPVNENNVKLVDPTPAYPGIRYVFNVVDSSTEHYEEGLRRIGFENDPPNQPGCGQNGVPECTYPGASPLCDDVLRETLRSYGFGPLNRTVSSHNLIGATCRQYTP
jgi:phosphate transport system substrate-binding protein